MKFLKLLLWIVLVIAGIYLILCATGPKDMNTSQTKSMNASPETVYSIISDFDNFKSWSAWNQRDTAMKITITGNPGAIGHSNEWVSESEGSGKQWLAEVRQNEFLKTGLLMADRPDTAYSTFTLTASGDSTTVTWAMLGGELPFLARGMVTVLGFKSGLEKDFADGLTNLAKLAESMPKAPKVEFEITDIPDTWYVGKMFKGQVATEITSSLYEAAYGEIGAYLGSMKTEPAGPPVSIAHTYQDATMTMELEIGLPTATELPATATLSSGKIPAGKAARYTYMGDYQNMPAAWDAFMGAVMSQHKPRWSPYEIYMTDPMSEPDTSKWLTYMIIPIEP